MRFLVDDGGKRFAGMDHRRAAWGLVAREPSFRREMFKRCLPWGGFATLGGAAVLLLACSGVATWGILASGLWPSLAWLAAADIALLIPYMVFLIRFNRTARGVMVAAERCAACGCDLRGLPFDDEGFRICPMCGGKWRL